VYDELLLACCAGAVAQLLRNFFGRGAGPAALALLLLAGMSPLLALAALHLAALFDHSLSALLHHRLGRVHPPRALRLAAWSIAGAALTLLLFALASASLQLALVVLAGCVALLCLSQKLPGIDQPLPSPLRTMAAAAILVMSASAQAFLRCTSSRREPRLEQQANAGFALLAVSAFSSVVFAVSAGVVPLLQVLGLLSGTVLVAPFQAHGKVAESRTNKPKAAAAQPDY
jgi:uncharacterized membrane protein YfcA